MAENLTWTKRLPQFTKRAAIGVVGLVALLVALYVLYVIVFLLGAALGLWQFSLD